MLGEKTSPGDVRHRAGKRKKKKTCSISKILGMHTHFI